MNICIVYGSGAVGLNSRLNKRFEPLQSVAGDDVIAFRSLASFDDASSSNYSVYIFHNCFDARSSLLIHSLFSKGKIIGVDLPVLADLPKPEIQSQWLKSVISSVDFITTDTGQHFEPLIDGAEHIPVFVVPRPNNSTGKDNLVATVAERRRYMSLSRHINICWIGSGVRDIDTEGLKDAVAFGATLAEVQRHGYEASLNIVAHQDALDTRMLSALKTLPIRWKAEAWSDEIEEKRQRQSLVTYLPFNSRAQSRAYAHDRAEAAVANGSRVYCPLPPLDGEFSTFTYRSLSALISDLESSAASVANDTETAVVSGASGAGDAYHPLNRLIDFLRQLTPGDRVKSPPLIAVIHGQTSTVPIHKFAQRTGHLSVVTSSFAHSVSTDLDLAYDTESDTLWAILSPTASAHLSELFRGLLEEDVGGGKKARRRLPLNHLPRKLIAELRSECLGIPAFLSPSAYIERLDLYQELIGHLFPGAIPIISEPGEPIAVVATRRPKPTAKLNEGASQTRLEAAKRPTLKVAWLVQKLDFSSASVRYRSLHMAMAMGHLDTRHSYFTDTRKLVEKIDQFDVVVIVKRLEPSILSVLAAGKSGETAFFLDLCDDMLSPFYRREGSAQNQMVFAAAASMLDGVIVPSVEMASHIRTYCRNKKVSLVKVFVVPDIAETPELFAEARDFFVGLTDQAARPLPYLQAFRQVNLPAKVASRANPMRVVWFGNFGSPHSNFGIPSLLSAVSALQKVSQDIPLELTVISNDKNRFTAILADCGVPTRYVPWAEDTIYDQLRQADLALLTNGDDEFSKLKSANRALLALALGIPVVATGNAAMRKLVPAIWADDYETGLRKYLGQDRNEEIATALSHAQTILRRYDLSSNARRWRRILTATIASKRHRPKAENGRKALIFVEFGFAADLLRDAVRNYRSSNILPMITVNGATPINPALLKVLIELEILPTVLMPDDLKTHDVRWLRGAGEILVEAPNGAMSKQLISWARASGMVVKSLGASGESGNRSPSEPSMKSHKEGPIVGLSPIYSDPSQVPVLGGEAFLRRTSQIAAQRQQSFAVPHSSVLHR